MKYFIYLALLLSNIPGYAQQTWESVAENSYIKFIASYDDADFEGHFSRFKSVFNYHPEQVETSELNSSIDITSVNTQSRDTDQALAESDWFYFSKFPQASFRSLSINQLSDDLLELMGVLNIRDQQREIMFNLQWLHSEDNSRIAQGQFTIDRRDYNVGIGEWLEDDTIGFEVTVEFLIHYELKQ